MRRPALGSPPGTQRPSPDRTPQDAGRGFAERNEAHFEDVQIIRMQARGEERRAERADQHRRRR